MFDITSSKLLLLGIVALLVIGPKDFPALLRTIGKYVGIIRGHAKEFRAQFDEAMRETELASSRRTSRTSRRRPKRRCRPTGHGGDSLERGAPRIDTSIDTAAKPRPIRLRTMRTACRSRRRRAHHRQPEPVAEPGITRRAKPTCGHACGRSGVNRPQSRDRPAEKKRSYEGQRPDAGQARHCRRAGRAPEEPGRA